MSSIDKSVRSCIVSLSIPFKIAFLAISIAFSFLPSSIKLLPNSVTLSSSFTLSKSFPLKNLFAKAWEKFGRLDVVIANAGVINFGNTWELTDEQVEKVINIDLIGTWRTDKYATQYMLKQGFGRIINIASTSGLYGTPKLATYCMAKWGVLGLTKTLAKEVGSKGIIVNALCPTKVKTPMCETQSYVEFINELTGKNFKDYKEMYAGVPFLDVEDISDMVYWLGTSRAAGKFNGRDVALDLGTLQC